MVKKIAVLTVFLMFSSMTAFGADTIKVVVNGSEIQFQGQQPVIDNGRTLVPLRGIFEALGAEVTWIEDSQMVIAQKGKEVVSMEVGSKELVRGSVPSAMDTAPKLMNGSVIVPARAAAEAFGAEVQWNDASKTVTIQEGSIVIKTETPKTTETTEQAPTITTTEKKKTAENELVGSREIIEEKKSANHKVVAQVKITYPQFENPGNKNGLIQFNRKIKQAAEQRAKDFLEISSNELNALEEQAKKDSFQPYELTQSYEVTYQRDDIVSIVIHCTQNSTTQKTTQNSFTFDISSGQELEPSDIVLDSAKELDELLIKAFQAMISEQPTAFFSNADKLIAKNLEKVQFYVTKDGICFYFNPEIVAPESLGVVGFSIDWMREQ